MWASTKNVSRPLLTEDASTFRVQVFKTKNLPKIWSITFAINSSLDYISLFHP